MGLVIPSFSLYSSSLQILFLPLIGASITIELDVDFKIDFNPNCSQFLVLIGEEDYTYLYREKEDFILWHIINDTYSIFTHPWSETVIFEWPNIINGQEMDDIISHDLIILPSKFDEEQILCEIYGLTVGSMLYYPTPIESQVFKCDSSITNPIQYVLQLLLAIIAGVALVAAGLGNYEPIRAILRCLISGIFQRGWEFLP